MSHLPTQRLRLILCDERYLQLLIEGDAAFEAATGWRVAAGYLDYPEALPYSLAKVREAAEGEKEWWMPRLYLHQEENCVVGLGGYKGPPQEGAVEIGYSVSPAFRGQGYATEAATELTRAALLREGITKVRAHTLAETNASGKVLQKSGFARVGEAYDRDDGYLWVWENVLVVEKAYAYIEREREGKRELLVFRHRDFVEAGLQVPGGTLDPNETPEIAVLREVEEESGLTDCTIARKVTTDVCYSPNVAQWHKRHFFEVTPSVPCPDNWEHTVSSGEDDEGLVFCYQWMPLAQAAHELVRQQGGALQADLEAASNIEAKLAEGSPTP